MPAAGAMALISVSVVTNSLRLRGVKLRDMILVIIVELHTDFFFPSLILVTNVKLLWSLSEYHMLFINPVGIIRL
jgi:hypothetical protein